MFIFCYFTILHQILKATFDTVFFLFNFMGRLPYLLFGDAKLELNFFSRRKDGSIQSQIGNLTDIQTDNLIL